MTFQKYDSMKDSRIPWIGEIPKHWEVKPLFAYCKENQEKNTDGKIDNVLSLSYGNIVRRDVTDNFGLLPESFNSYQILKPGILVLRLTDLQNDKKSLRVGLAKEKGIITSAYSGLLPNPKILPEYLYYLLHSYDISKVFYGMGGGVRQSLKFSDLKKLPLLYFPFKEQKQIVEYLDRNTKKIDDEILINQKLIEYLKEKREFLINNVITKGLDDSVPMKNSKIEWIGKIPKTWKYPKLKYVLSLLKDGTHNPPERTDTGIKLLSGATDIKNSKISFKKCSLISKEDYLDLHKSYQLQHDDILLTIVATLGNVAMVNSKDLPFSMQRSIAVLRPKSILLNKLLFYFLHSTYFRNELYRRNHGSVKPGIYLEDLKNIPIVYPSEIDEQKQIVGYLNKQTNKIDSLISYIYSIIKELRESKQSLIFSVVTGKICIVA